MHIVWKIILTLWAFVLTFFLGRLTVFIQNSHARLPPRIVTENNVKIPVIFIDEWDSHHISGHVNVRELRFDYQGEHILSKPSGVFEIQRRL